MPKNNSWRKWFGLDDTKSGIADELSDEALKIALDDEVLCADTLTQRHSQGSLKRLTSFLYYYCLSDLGVTRRQKQVIALAKHDERHCLYVEILNQMLRCDLTWPAMLEDIAACGLRRDVSVTGPAPGNGVSNLDIARFQLLIECLFASGSPVRRLSLFNLVYFGLSDVDKLSNSRDDLVFNRAGIGVFMVSRRTDLLEEGVTRDSLGVG